MGTLPWCVYVYRSFKLQNNPNYLFQIPVSVTERALSHRAEDSNMQVTLLHSRKMALAQVLLSKPRKTPSTEPVGKNLPL